MSKIVIIPLDSAKDYINYGRTYEFLESYYNPGNYFDEVYCLHPSEKTIKIGKVQFINAKVKDFQKIIEIIQPDIVRAYAGFGPCDWAIGNRVKNIPVVVSVHDPNPNLINQSLKYADYVICMSQRVKDAVKLLTNIKDDKLYIMPNRVDTNKFCFKNEMEFFKKLNKIYGNGKHILHVGRKVEQKNLDTVINAIQYLPFNYSVVFIGAGNTECYEKLARKCGVQDRCFFIECVPNDDLPIYYSWCDCMCTPSRWEGFGIVFIEAAACECSIITSNIAPMNEFLKNGVNSILVDDYENPKVIAQQIILACENNNTISTMRNNARKVGLKFSKPNIDKQEIELYKKFIEKGTDNAGYYEIKEEREKLKKNIILFGAGMNGKNIIKLFGKEGISFFADNDENKIGKEINGIKIIGYDELLKIHEKYTIVVTPNNREEIIYKFINDGVKYIERDWYILLKEKERQTV